MNPILHALPLDWSGSSLDNRTKGEQYDLADQNGLPFRVVVLRNGYFFTETMYIIDGVGYELKEGRDYQCIGFLSDAVDKTAKTVCSVIAIINPKVNNIVEVDAQMLGGPYCSVAQSIVEAAKGLQNTTRKIHWNNITGKPDDFRPNGHLHALWELFGFTPQVLQLKRMTSGIERKVQKDYDALMLQFNLDMSEVEKQLTAVDAVLTAHIADVTSNPHRETKQKLGLGNVPNQPVATVQEAQAPDSTVMNKYATPYSMAVSIKVNFGDKLAEHVANRNNPHRVTAAQLSVYTVAQWNTISAEYVPVGSTVRQSTNIFGMTPTTFYNSARVNNNVANINVNSGRIHPARFSTSGDWPGRDYYLAPSLNWLPIAPKFKQFEVIPFSVCSSLSLYLDLPVSRTSQDDDPSHCLMSHPTP